MRIVELTGTADVAQIGNQESVIANALTRQGFDVVSVNITKSTFSFFSCNLTIAVNVENQYTAEQARVSAIAVIKSIPYGSIYGGKLFSNVNLQILSEGQPQTTSTDTTKNTESLDDVLKYITKAAVPGLAEGVSSTLLIGVLGLAAVLVITQTGKK